MQLTNRNFISALLLIAPLLVTACGGGGGTDGSSAGTGGDGGAMPSSSTTLDTPSETTTPPTASGTVRSYVYAADDFSRTASGYSVSADTGQLTELGSVDTERGLPNDVIVHPSGKFVYVMNDDGVSAYRIDPATGAVTPLGMTDPEGAWPMKAAIDASGGFLLLSKNYAQDSNPFPPPQVPEEISTYRIDPDTGALTLASTIVVGKFIGAIEVSARGHVAYVSIPSRPPMHGASILAYSIDPANGALTLLAEAVTTGPLAVHPEGNYVYVASNLHVSTYKLDRAAGTLMEVGVAVPSGQATIVAVNPAGPFVYVMTRNEVWTYRIDASTGALIQSAAPMATSDGPASGAFGDLGHPVAFDPNGKFAYVGGGSSIFVYSVDAVTGALTPVGTPVARSRRAISVAVASVADESTGP